jgi:hypothetical protein
MDKNALRILEGTENLPNFSFTEYTYKKSRHSFPYYWVKSRLFLNFLLGFGLINQLLPLHNHS